MAGEDDRKALERRIKKFERKLQQLRGGKPKTREVERFAVSLGRERLKASQAKREPTYHSKVFPNLRVITIPHHSADLKKGTAMAVLDQLEGMDIAAYRNLLETRGSRDVDENA